MEAKAARIKDWVTNKLKELEEQNQHLREQNAHCNEQMDLLRTRLDQLQELGQTCSKTNSRRESAAEVRGLTDGQIRTKSDRTKMPDRDRVVITVQTPSILHLFLWNNCTNLLWPQAPSLYATEN